MKKLVSISLLMPVVILSLSVFNSCNNNSSSNNADNQKKALEDSTRIDSLTSQKKDLIEFKFMTAVASLPSPFQVVNNLHQFKAPYKAELLNPPGNVDRYVTAYKQGVNFGIYGIDLAYISLYGHSQDQLNYYSSAQKLAQALNIDAQFSQFTQRFTANESNPDSIVHLLDDAYSETDAYLRKNERYLVSSHIMAGALVELNYLSLNMLKDLSPANDSLLETIYNEDLYIEKLINLLQAYTDADSKALTKSLEEYQKSYLEIIKAKGDLAGPKLNSVIPLITKLRNNLVK